MRLQPRNRFEVNSDYEILASLEGIREVTNGVTIDTTKVPAAVDGSKLIKKGMPVAKITASGKFRPYTGTTVQTTAAASATAVILTDASRLIVGDEVTIGSETKTISAINYGTNTITVTALSAEKTAGTAVATTDGGADPSVILKRAIDVKAGDHVVAGFEMAKVIASRIPVTVDTTLRQKMLHIVFA
jgi:hypothetical protein